MQFWLTFYTLNRKLSQNTVKKILYAVNSYLFFPRLCKTIRTSFITSSGGISFSNWMEPLWTAALWDGKRVELVGSRTSFLVNFLALLLWYEECIFFFKDADINVPCSEVSDESFEKPFSTDSELKSPSAMFDSNSSEFVLVLDIPVSKIIIIIVYVVSFSK